MTEVEIRDAVAEAEIYTLSPEAAEEERLRELAEMDPITYDRLRKAEAEKMGIRASALDQSIAKLRKQDGNSDAQGTAVGFEQIDPWPAPVDGAALLDEITETLLRYVAFDAESARATALWIVFTHSFEAFHFSPRMHISSPEKRCGKSTLLNVIDRLVSKPLLAMNISPSVLFRVVEMYKPTLLIDEADSFAKDNEDLRGILNSGHARNGSVMRSVGDDHAPRKFSTWSPLCLAGIGSLPGTVEDRSISIRLRRKLSSEEVERLRMDRTEHLHLIARKCARWAQDAFDDMEAHDPEDFSLPNDRASDNWRPLISIAEIAGGNWPAIARNTAQAMTTEESDQESIAVRVLADIREALESDGPEAAIWTETLLDKLKLDPEKPWATYGRSPGGLNAQQLARLLRQFGINSGTVRVGNQVTKAGASTAKGYRKNTFNDAFARYLGIPAVTTTQPAENCAKPAISSRHKSEVVTAENSLKPAENLGCDGVTARNPQIGPLGQSGPENRKWGTEI